MKLNIQGYVLLCVSFVLIVSIVLLTRSCDQVSELKKQAKDLEKSEQDYKKQAEMYVTLADVYKKTATTWKVKYDSSLTSELNARKEATDWKNKYEVTRNTHLHFANDKQRDSVLKTLYPR